MDDIALDGNDLAASTDGQDWRVAWHAAITLPLPRSAR
jgi:hypothetical protein